MTGSSSTKRSSAEFITLREMCGLTQAVAAEVVGVSHRGLQHWEAGARGVPWAKIDRLRKLDETIRTEASRILAPVARAKIRPARFELTRYRTEEAYAAGQPAEVAAGLTLDSYHAMLGRVIDGLARMGVTYRVRYPEEAVMEAAMLASLEPDDEEDADADRETEQP